MFFALLAHTLMFFFLKNNIIFPCFFPQFIQSNCIKMEMELGFKLTRVADEFTSDFQIAKDRSGPVFISRETDSMFILTAYLKGYKRGNINIDINEDGTLIGISGERRVQETVMIAWQVHKKETETKGFKKVFKIPDGVILDKIEADFNEDDSTLKITMPKKVKGIRGVSIEEIKENKELVKQGSGRLQIQDEKLKAKAQEDTAPGKIYEENVEFGKPMPGEEEKAVEENFYSEDVEKSETPKEVENQEKLDDMHEKTEAQQNQELDHSATLDTNKLPKKDDQKENNNQDSPDKVNGIREEEKSDEENESAEEVTEAEAGGGQEEEHRPREKASKVCIPMVAGSALFLSFVVFVVQVIRSKIQNSRRRD